MKIRKLLNESRADISRLTETKLYKELKKIVDKASTEAFNGKCKFVGVYDDRTKQFYELAGATRSEVKKCSDIIKKEIKDLLSPFIDPLGGRIDYNIVHYDQDAIQQSDDILFCAIVFSFNKEFSGLPTFSFYFNTASWEIEYSFSNSSVGHFDDFEKFTKLLKVLNDFCEKFLK